MPQRLRFGLVTAQPTWPALLAAWQRAQERGFESVWLIDHLVPYTDPRRPCLEAWTALAALAAQTERVRLGLLTTNALFRNPVWLAKQAVTIDQISNGRLELALGSGNAAPSHPMAGIDPGTPAERIACLPEVVAIVDGLLRGEVVTFRGHFYQTHEAVMRPAPVQQPRPPLTIGAHRAAALRVAAEYADTWNTFGGFGLSARDAFQMTRKRMERLDGYCAWLDRHPGTLARSFLAGFTRDTPWASPDAFQDFVGRYRQIGFTEVLFRWPQDDQLDTFTRVAHEILPTLRAVPPGRSPER